MIDRLSTVVVLAGALGCGGRLVSPAQGGEAWTALSSRHFEVQTDLPRDEARETLAELERMYTLFTEVVFPAEAARAGHIGVVIFRDKARYDLFAPKGSGAYFSPALANDVEPEPTAVMGGPLTEWTRATFQHELAHYFMRRGLGHFPVWLSEGLADYYSTLHVKDGEVVIGSAIPKLVFTEPYDWSYRTFGEFHRQPVPVNAVPSIETLLHASPEVFYATAYTPGAKPTLEDERRQGAFYGGAWALVHMLRNGPSSYRARFSSFVGALDHGKHADEAWEIAFRGVDPALMEKEFRAYLRLDARIVRVKRYTPGPPAGVEQERELTDAEVRLLWARLLPWTGARAARAREQLDAALAGEPSLPAAHFWRGLFALRGRDLPTATREIDAALAAEPAEPRYLLARLEVERARTPVVESALAEVSGRLAKVARTGAELEAVARVEVGLGRAGLALPLAERAIQVDPSSWSGMATYALALFGNCRTDEAVAAEERALELLPEGYQDKILRARLRKFQMAARSTACDAREHEGKQR